MANKPNQLKRPGEFDLIERFFAPLTGDGSFGLKDDAAVISPKVGYDTVITQDAILEQVHFFSDDPLDLIAKKALRVNVSDIIAKGANPTHYSIALGVPDWMEEKHFVAFSAGLREDQGQYGVTLTGGDTYRSQDRLAVSVTMLGELPVGSYVSRLGARTGDLIFVTGTIGDAQLGLELRKSLVHFPPDGTFSIEQRELIQRQILPNPPMGIQSVIRQFATASMDVSDGLIGDLQKLCLASNVAATVFEENIPTSKEARHVMESEAEPNGTVSAIRRSMLTGGDDYQCLFTVPCARRADLLKEALNRGLHVSQIGEVSPGPSGELAVLSNGKQVLFENGSYSHF